MQASSRNPSQLRGPLARHWHTAGPQARLQTGHRKLKTLDRAPMAGVVCTAVFIADEVASLAAGGGAAALHYAEPVAAAEKRSDTA